MPLTIYADILVLNNLYIDFFLLWCVKKFLHLHPGKGRLVLGALAGALSALLVLLPVSRLILLLFGALSALAATAAAFAPLKPFLFWKAALAFWVFSFLLAGFLLFLLTYLPTSGLAVLPPVTAAFVWRIRGVQPWFSVKPTPAALCMNPFPDCRYWWPKQDF